MNAVRGAVTPNGCMLKGLAHMDIVPQKRCPRCKQYKPATLEYFGKYSRAKDGLKCWCKSCIADDRKDYVIKKRSNADWLSDYRTSDAQRKRIARQDPEQREKDKQALRKSRQKAIENDPDWYEKKNAYERELYRSNTAYRLKITQKQKERYNTPEGFAKALAKYHKRNALIASLPNDFTPSDWQYCLEYHHFCCAVCGKQLADLFGNVNVHADHWIPLSSPDCPGTIPTNMICLCNQCNLSKHANNPSDWVTSKLGVRKGKSKLKAIELYFSKVRRC